MKYKLIKEYPNSPKKGTIAEKTSPHGYQISGFISLHETMVENQSEYWEKVIEIPEYVKCISKYTGGIKVTSINHIYCTNISPDFSKHDWVRVLQTSKFIPATKEEFDEQEKDYEILSFSCPRCSYVLGRSGLFSEQHAKWSNINSTITLKEGLEGNTYSIHSVKRKSDGEIFTIGDKTKDGIIKSIFIPFEFGTTTVCIQCDNKRGIYLQECKKVKQPLFTTEDGIDINLGDQYYELITPRFHNTQCIWNIIPYDTRDNIIYNQECNRKNGRLWFSTKEKAEEYILMNKPCLSINNLISLNKPGLAGVCNMVHLGNIEIIKNLVKSKI